MSGGRGERSPSYRGRGARVIEVDERNWTARVQFIRGEEPAETVPIMMPYISNRGGGWMGAVPEEGDWVRVAKESYGESYVIDGFMPLPRARVSGEDEGSTTTRFDEPRLNYSMGRRPARPGDIGIVSSSGVQVMVRRAGVIEIEANRATATRWLKDQYAIRSTALTIEQSGGFGQSSWYTLRDAEREARDRTPTGFSAWVKSHAEASPIVNVELGAVLSDEKMRLPGRPLRHSRREGSIAARFLVFDQAFADRYAALGEPPDPNGARVAIRMDEEGNTSWLQSGTQTLNVENQVVFVAGRRTERVEGSSVTTVVGEYSLEGREHVRISGDRGVSVATGGDFVLECRRFIVNGDNDNIRLRGAYTVEAGGALELTSGTALTLDSAGDTTVASGGTMATAVGGRSLTDVFNRAAVENTGLDVLAYGVKVHNGKTRLQNVNGSFEIVVGPSTAPIARIKIHRDLAAPTQIGRIEIGFPITRTGLTLSPDGSWQISGTIGAIKCDATGRIQIGNKASPVVGNVVTTLSHPVDFMTGLPIRGHADVVLSAGPQSVLVGAPSLGVQPPTVPVPEPPAV